MHHYHRNFILEKDFLCMVSEFKESSLEYSSAISQSIEAKSFVSASASSKYLQYHAGSTYRTVASNKNSELTEDKEIKTFICDFFKNDASFLAEIIVVVSASKDSKYFPLRTTVSELIKFIATKTFAIITNTPGPLDNSFEKAFSESLLTTENPIPQKLPYGLSFTCVTLRNPNIAMVINIGEHTISKIYSSSSNNTSNKFQLDEILQIESAPNLLLAGEAIDEKKIGDEIKNSDKYFSQILEKLILTAEIKRQKNYKFWQTPVAKLWLLLSSRLTIFQNRLMDSHYHPQIPEDPIYQRLRSASPDNLWPLMKALQITQSLEDSAEIPQEDFTELGQQWTEESKEKPLTWDQAYKQRHHNLMSCGGSVGVLVVEPVKHLLELSHALKLAQQPSAMSVELFKIKGLLLTYLPTAEHKLSLDTVREFVYQVEAKSTAKLTIMYRLHSIAEEKNWQKNLNTARDQLLTSLAKDIFHNLNYFDTRHLGGLRDCITDLLSKSPYNNVKASLLFCLTTIHDQKPTRYLVGVGDCLALTAKNGLVNTAIGPMYDAKDNPILLDSLAKPEDSKSVNILSFLRFSPQKSAIQIVMIQDPEVEIRLISGRILAKNDLQLIKSTSSTSSNLQTYELKILNNEAKTLSTVIDIIHKKRRDILNIIENPLIKSAWKKLDRESENLEINTSNKGEFQTHVGKATKLSEEEFNLIFNLWDIAKSEANQQSPLTWQQVRARYFFYFHGVTEAFTTFIPSSLVEIPSLYQYIIGLADYHCLKLKDSIIDGDKIRAFASIIYCIGDDTVKIYEVICQKLKLLLADSFDKGEDFWTDLVTLIAVKCGIHFSNLLDLKLEQVISRLEVLIRSGQPYVTPAPQPSLLNDSLLKLSTLGNELGGRLRTGLESSIAKTTQSVSSWGKK